MKITKEQIEHLKTLQEKGYLFLYLERPHALRRWYTTEYRFRPIDDVSDLGAKIENIDPSKIQVLIPSEVKWPATMFLVDGGTTFYGTKEQADDCYGIHSEISTFSDKKVVEILQKIFPDSKVEIKDG